MKPYAWSSHPDERKLLGTTKNSFVQEKNELVLDKIVILRSKLVKLLAIKATAVIPCKK